MACLLLLNGFLNGCALLDRNYHAHQESDFSAYGTGYDEFQLLESQPAETKNKGSVDAEKPVQMTPHDSQLKQLKPKLKKEMQTNDNVLLPISSGDL